MAERYFILATLPILFMLHDFEEIILLKAWFMQNQSFLEKKFPQIGSRMTRHFNLISTPGFAFGVAEEFVILAVISLSAILNPNWLLLWFGAFTAFTLHLVYHLLTAIVLRRYVASVATSFVFLPICIYLMIRFLALWQFDRTVLLGWTIFAIVLVLANGAFLHLWLIPKFESFVIKY